MFKKVIFDIETAGNYSIQNLCMKWFLFLSCICILLVTCKKKTNRPDTVFCQGFLIRTISASPTGEEMFSVYTWGCNGICPDGNFCEIISATYDPPKDGNIIKEEWCGCKGDALPDYCDIFLQTQIVNGDTLIKPFCTGAFNCPVETDTCLLIESIRERDTLRNELGMSEVYLITDTLICDCRGND